MDHEDTTKVRGIVRAGVGRGVAWSEAIVSRSEIVLDSPMQRIHLPRDMDGLQLSGSELSASVPDLGLVQFAPWRNRRWRTALRAHGWMTTDDPGQSE
ncbi:hypothetical protein [Dermatobacter hominis]|uniref:hypothetical protein n=1 Tax=Dermatobacter hominis TaxID=2884263 RepID=UPI001D11A19E|nr:hypothetical protein [Dermatobacter hominis]UDY35878.1 hypothetical protein LH044_21490 [Dermatobacter hominis]